MRCLIIHNPASGPSSDEIFAFTHALAQGGDEVVTRFIGDGMEPEDAVADVREFDRVVVSGGDGTVSNVLDQMRGCGVPTLVFPSGTACLFFNNIGNAPEAAALAKACRAGRTVKADMGELFWLDEDGNEQEYYYVAEDNDGDGVRVERTSDGDEFDLGISREGVAAATRDVNAIYKDGVQVAAELKSTFDEISDSLSFLKKKK